jgi:hypothetical protein
MGAGYITWMVALTVAIMVIMAASLRRWRTDYCGSHPNELPEDNLSDTSSTTSGSIRGKSPKGRDNPVMSPA